MIRLVFVLSVVVLSLKSFAGTVSDLAVIDGIRDNQLVGYGLVVGLDGTGDKSAFTQSSLEAYLRNNGIKLPSNVSVKSKNVAAVTVTASLPSFASVGQRLDVTVSSLGDAKSLRGGMLILTPLKGVDSNVYALAQGNLLVGGMDASGADGSKISINISSVGRIPSGATVEVPFEAKLVHEGDVTLNLKSPSFLLAGSMVDALNEDFGYPVAHAANHSKVIVKAPDAELDLVSFIGRVQSVFVSEPKDAAKVIVNSRTGTVVITETVTVSPVAITHGGITLEVKEDPEVALLNDNVEQDTDIAITNEQKRLFELKQGANLNDIVDSFNDMGLAPSDLVAILEALKSSGSLKADLEII